MDIIEKIDNWSRTAGLPVLDIPTIPSESRAELAISLIAEEFQEFNEAETLEDKADAAGDLLWVVVRLMREWGFDPNKVIEAIYQSNMSKFDTDELSAIMSVQEYSKKDIIAYYEQVGELFVIKRAEDHKILKSHKFRKPDFSSIFVN